MKKSAGILLYRFVDEKMQVLLAHPGGPLYKNRDQGVWTIPKGEYDTEDGLEAAKREFREETGIAVDGEFIGLHPVKQKSGKLVHAFALEKDIRTDQIESNLFEMEWPPRSGKKQSFPEIDRVDWFDLNLARHKIIPGQIPILEELEEKVS